MICGVFKMAHTPGKHHISSDMLDQFLDEEIVTYNELGVNSASDIGFNPRASKTTSPGVPSHANTNETQAAWLSNNAIDVHGNKVPFASGFPDVSGDLKSSGPPLSSQTSRRRSSVTFDPQGGSPGSRAPDSRPSSIHSQHSLVVGAELNASKKSGESSPLALRRTGPTLTTNEYVFTQEPIQAMELEDPFRSPVKTHKARQSLVAVQENLDESPAMAPTTLYKGRGSLHSSQPVWQSSDNWRKNASPNDSDRENTGGVPLPRPRAATSSTSKTATHHGLNQALHRSAASATSLGASYVPASFVASGKDIEKLNKPPTRNASPTRHTKSISAPQTTGHSTRHTTPGSTKAPPTPVQQPTNENDTAYGNRALEMAELIKNGAFERVTEQEPAPGIAMRAAHQNRPHSLSMSNVADFKGGKGLPPKGLPLPYIPHVQPKYPPYNDPPENDPVVLALEANGVPNAQSLLSQCPFHDKVATSNPNTIDASMHGVVSIKDVPYDSTKQEVIAFLGRNARLVMQPDGTPYYAIHITMERSTAKTLNIFAEFESPEEAQITVNRFEKQRQKRKDGEDKKCRWPRLGDRAVQVDTTSQSELMAELFPKAKCVTWKGCEPHVGEPEPGTNLTGFSGFVTNEELHSVEKFAAHPQRSRYLNKHPQRVYESMISLILKYPWWRSDLYTLSERDQIYRATREMTRTLSNMLYHGRVQRIDEAKVTPQLLEQLLTVGLSCPAFTEQQRHELYIATQGMVGTPRFVSAEFSPHWPFTALGRRDNVSEAYIRYYAHIIKLQAQTNLKSSADTSDQQLANQCDKSIFGAASYYGPSRPKTTTMAEAIQHELSVLAHFFNQAEQLLGGKRLGINPTGRSIAPLGRQLKGVHRLSQPTQPPPSMLHGNESVMMPPPPGHRQFPRGRGPPRAIQNRMPMNNRAFNAMSVAAPPPYPSPMPGYAQMMASPIGSPAMGAPGPIPTGGYAMSPQGYGYQ